mmetsp:Transcript_6260/g.9692  ORF Transcript_6260/g.9692 Transcript_6260/m.9692 type:complete len:169 (-) Transcript_6260:119-625(-)
MVAAAAGEVLLFAGVPCPGLLTASYTMAVFAATIGIMLTLLFLKFNYFEKKWQEEVAAAWELRGFPFSRLTLISHCLSLPVGVLDVVLVRDRRFLTLCNPTLAVNLVFALMFAGSWYAFIHVLWRATDYKCWPYPFLHEFNTMLKRLAFFVVIYIGLTIVMLPVQFSV